MVAMRGEYLLRHLEKFLGKATERWQTSDEASFQVLLFPNNPYTTENCLVTFGLSAVELSLGAEQPRLATVELLICANNEIEPKRLAATLIGVASHALRHRSLPDLHEVLPGQGAVHDNPLFEHFYLTSPGYFPAEFDRCTAVVPPIEMVQLLPITSRERVIITQQGWAHFEEAAVADDIDLLEYDRRAEIVVRDS